LSASYVNVPPVNVLVPQVATTLPAVGALTPNKGELTLHTAVHPPAKALALVNEKNTDYPGILVETAVVVEEHSVAF